MTAHERTGWRDEQLSARHRDWGFNCPAVDLDFVMCEYNTGLPAAIVEYKRYTASHVDLSHPTYRALVALANKAELPFIVARYWPGDWWFVVLPGNDRAERLYPKQCRALTERRFVRSLYYIRRIVLSRQEEALIASRNDIAPPPDLCLLEAS